MACPKAFAVTALLLAVRACPAASPPGQPQATLQEAVQALVADYLADCRARVGVHVVSLAEGKTLCDIRAEELFLPASCQKLFTTAVALKRLGPDFAFSTRLAMAGKDLVVLGDGDPTTGDPLLAEARNETIYAAFDRWAEALKQRGIKRIEGDVVIRTGLFCGPFVHPDWPAEQLQRWYAAPVAAVNFNDNCLEVGFEVQDKAVLPVVSPQSRIVRLVSHVELGKRHLWRCSFDKTGTEVTLSGTVTRSTPEPLPVAVPSPPVLFGCVLIERLLRAGIGINGKLVITSDPRAAPGQESLEPIAEQVSPISAALSRANKQSLNMMAECLFLRSAVEPGVPADWSRAARTAARVLAEDYGLSGKAIRIADGSGLSRRNRAAPGAITSLLGAMVGERRFVDSLAVAGVDGSLEGRLAGPRCRGRVLAKTGSLAGVSALSGYVLDQAGKPALAFSILINGRTWGKSHTARGLQEEICETLVGWLDQPTTAPAAASEPASSPAP